MHVHSPQVFVALIIDQGVIFVPRIGSCHPQCLAINNTSLPVGMFEFFVLV